MKDKPKFKVGDLLENKNIDERFFLVMILKIEEQQYRVVWIPTEILKYSGGKNPLFSRISKTYFDEHYRLAVGF